MTWARVGKPPVRVAFTGAPAGISADMETLEDPPPCITCRKPTKKADEVEADGEFLITFEPCGHRLHSAGPVLRGWTLLHHLALPLAGPTGTYS